MVYANRLAADTLPTPLDVPAGGIGDGSRVTRQPPASFLEQPLKMHGQPPKAHQGGLFEALLMPADFFEQQKGFAVDPSRQPTGLFMNFSYLACREGAVSQHAGHPGPVFQVGGGLFFGKGCHEDFVDNGLGRQPACELRETLAHLRFGQQDNVLDSAVSLVCDGMLQQ